MDIDKSNFAYHFFFFVFLGHKRTNLVLGSINLPDF